MNATRPDNEDLFAEFAAEHAKRARRFTVEQEREAAWKLMAHIAKQIDLRNPETRAARMAHERELRSFLEGKHDGSSSE